MSAHPLLRLSCRGDVIMDFDASYKGLGEVDLPKFSEYAAGAGLASAVLPVLTKAVMSPFGTRKTLYGPLSRAWSYIARYGHGTRGKDRPRPLFSRRSYMRDISIKRGGDVGVITHNGRSLYDIAYINAPCEDPGRRQVVSLLKGDLRDAWLKNSP